MPPPSTAYPHTYPPPPSPHPPTYTPFAVRPLPALSPLPLPPPSLLPSLPSPPRPSSFPGYKLTTHLTPSARPRASPTATKPLLRPPYPPTQASASKEQRQKDVGELLLNMRKQRAAVCSLPSWVDDPQEPEPQLWNCLHRYLRTSPHSSQGEGVTLLLAHANGFPKEIWQPVLSYLFSLYSGIDEVWLWESVNHGDSSLINASHLGDTFDWADNARDVLQFLTFHRPPSGSEAPLHLPPHPAEPPRRVIGIGHSLGGGTLTRAALAKPELFDALILVDPVIIAEHAWNRRGSEMARYDALVLGALARRSVWGSKEEAKRGFLKSPFFKVWNPEALEAYVEYGLAPVPPSASARDPPAGSADACALPSASASTGVMLKQSPYDEASIFSEPRAQAETWYLLPLLPERIELRWIMNGKTSAEATGGEERTRWTVWRRRGNSSNVRVREAGHLVAQEAPERLAEEIAQVLVRRYGKDGTGRGKKARL
ncbi:alpha/beta-hydrolase [Calocera viscosa TUFC12733]|uniref:Alpha/beta-hydrolase n=1 Tax=Calocera viscosa (strain TUFC12733) TaxID=1330018 RepID=A0A167PSD9_CALVF|nr:alpha/beta-hydrolase [Calocera viscosa TUFC12733]